MRLLTFDVVAPTANNDTFTAPEATLLTLNILSNDSDIDGTIDPTTLTISTNPNNGKIIVNTDGTIVYTPKFGFIGTDSFTYTVLDDSRETSNPATVTINNVVVSADVKEGNKATFTAIATDPGLNDLTYTWNFGDGTSPVFGSTVNHIFADNGDYTASLTVTDTNGGTTTQILIINVANTAPIVTAGDDQTIDEGQSVTFNSNFTDAGILDTHTIIWDFGDGTTSYNILNPTHTYADNGNYTATMIVTDSDNATSSDTTIVTVNNAAPIVTAGEDLSILEGQTVTFNGSFTDAGILDTHTITWDFGDGATANGILNPTHTYAVNGVYAVTLGVADNDGATSSDTHKVTVNNVAPTITNITADTDIKEGENATFTATATDPGLYQFSKI